jgi:hypothetical protein
MEGSIVLSRDSSRGLSPEARLTLLSACTKAVRASSRAEAISLAEAVDWSALAGQLRRRRLLSLLGERILEMAGSAGPENFAGAVREAIDQASARDGLLELISIQVIDALRAAGIASMALKGPLLGRAIYGRPGRRATADIDLLVASGDLLGALEVVQELGYTDPWPPPRPDALPLLHYRLEHERQELPPLELHWRVHWYEPDFSRELLDRGHDHGRLGIRPDLGDEFVSLLLFYARDGFVGLRQACDLAAWWDAFGAGLQSRVLEDVVARHPALERALVAGVHVAERVVGLPAAGLLVDGRRLERRVRLAMRLANPQATGSIKQQNAETSLIDWLLAPAGASAVSVRRQLLIPTALHARPPSSPASSLAGSIDRAARLLRRYVLSILRVAWEDGRRRLGR